MFVLSPSTLVNGRALDSRIVRRKALGQMLLLPRRGAGWQVSWRLIFESQPLRYLLALTPFVLAMVIWPDLAFPIAQAPIAMVILIGVVELKLLRVQDHRREGLMSEAEVERARDLLGFRATRVLKQIAARRGLTAGDLTLVIEQSELARIAPLTLVSLHHGTPKPKVLDLDADERRILQEGLFDDAFSERNLQRLNQREDSYVHHFEFDPRGVSAHARLSAFLDGAPEALPADTAPT